MNTVMIFGTFDIIHPGHLYLLKQAKRHGDQLIAVVARDSTVERVKGRRPHHSERERKQVLEAIRLVDRVVLGDKKDMYVAIKKIQPDVICLGYDQEVFVDQLKSVLAAHHIRASIYRLKAYAPDRCKTQQIIDDYPDLYETAS